MIKLVIRQMLMAAGGAALSLSMLGTLPANASRLNVDSVFIFGDSLTDTGNDYNVTGFAIPPSPFYFQGGFSNGPVWVEYLSEELNLSPVTYTSIAPNSPIPSDGINFAFGGATAGTDNSGGLFLLGVQEQIDAFITLLGSQTVEAEDLFFIMNGGSNDYNFTTNPTEVIARISSNLETLIGLGAHQILLLNLPNLGDSPLVNSQGPESVAFFNQLSSIHNTLLAQRVEQLKELYPTTQITLFDINSLFREAIVNPGAFGFNNVTNNCSGIDFPFIDPVNDFPTFQACRSTLEANPKAFLFYDNQHPTTTAHEIIAQQALATLEVPESNRQVPESTPMSPLAVLGLLGIAWLIKGKQS